jgi:hypothetical protein
MRERRRGGKSLKRVVGSRKELRTVVAFCEGQNSEPDYIKGLKKLPTIKENTSLNLVIFPEHGVPLTLVNKAIERKKDDEVDECWCIFDVEWPKNHPNLHDAIQKAEANEINLAVSNPCFEIWLVLHHREFNSFEDTETIERLSRTLDGRAGKSIPPATYMPKLPLAVKRAERLEHRHAKDGTEFPDNNPSSGMFRFVRAICADGV